MKANDRLRNKLYSKYSANISQIFKNQEWKVGIEKKNGEIEEVLDPYICPICGNFFIRDSLNQNSQNPLTLEHVPPKKLGGNPIILTCKNCNNKLGGNKLDSKLIWDLEIEPFIKRKPNSQIKANYLINQRTKTKGKLIFIEKNKFRFHFNPGSNPNIKKELDYLKKKLE